MDQILVQKIYLNRRNMKITKLNDEIWYFEDIIEDPKGIFESIENWMPVDNQPFMQTSIGKTRDFLEKTDNATFRVLDTWYREHPDFDDMEYKLLPSTAYYDRKAGPGYGSHSDFAANPDGSFEDVHATILGYFSDPSDYEGGEILFPDYDISVKPSLGSMIIFGFKVQHAVNPVLSGTRWLSSQFLVKNKAFYKILEINQKEITKEQEIRLRIEAPQWERKNGNVKR